jgi:CheY-like chemotaxis protein
LVEVRAELPVASTHVAETANRYRILVVEDTAVNQELARHQLEQLGMDYMIAESAEIGLDHLESSSFDAILMGHQLPGMNGRDATREIRRRGLLTPIVGLTASSIAADVRGCLDAGMNAFLAQPVGLEQLGTTLRQVLTRGDSAAPALTSSLTPTSTLTVDRVAVDESVLDELVAELRDRTIVENLVTTFLSELDARGADIAIGDHEKAARQAHTLKSSAKLLGALHLAELCAAAETDGSVRDALSAAAIAARVGLREWLIAVPKHPGTGMTYQVK